MIHTIISILTPILNLLLIVMAIINMLIGYGYDKENNTHKMISHYMISLLCTVMVGL